VFHSSHRICGVAKTLTNLILILAHTHTHKTKTKSFTECTAISTLKHLVILELSQEQKTGGIDVDLPEVSGLVALAPTVPYLAELTLTNSQLSDDVVQRLFSADSSPRFRLAVLGLEGCDLCDASLELIVPRCPFLVTFRFSSLFSPQAFAANTLECDPPLRVLSCPGSTAMTSETLALATERLPLLEELDVRECAGILAATLHEFLPRWRHLKRLWVSRLSCSAIAASVPLFCHPRLEDLTATHCTGVHPSSLMQLSEACPRLRVVDLSWIALEVAVHQGPERERRVLSWRESIEHFQSEVVRRLLLRGPSLQEITWGPGIQGPRAELVKALGGGVTKVITN
jgi:hypothetical protein